MQRDILSSLKQWINSKSRKPLVLRGARQVGKSTAVRLFAAKEALTLYEINLERHPHLDSVFATLNMDHIRSNLESALKKSIVDQGGLLFLDEVQATPHAMAALRYFYEDWPSMAVIAAGSLLEFELGDHSYSMPVGRSELPAPLKGCGFQVQAAFAAFLFFFDASTTDAFEAFAPPGLGLAPRPVSARSTPLLDNPVPGS